MSLRERTRELTEAGRLDEIEALVEREPRALRHLLALTYRDESAVRRTACRGVAMAARHHPELVESAIRRLVWAMNDESGTHAVTAPEVLRAIADVEPELLVPVAPDLTRLAADPSLAAGLAETLQVVAQRCPGQVGAELSRSLQRRLRDRASGKGDAKTACASGDARSRHGER